MDLNKKRAAPAKKAPATNEKATKAKNAPRTVAPERRAARAVAAPTSSAKPARESRTRSKRAQDPTPKGPALYDRAAIIDAPEHHRFARAFGTLTWGTWDADVRPLSVRIEDFVTAFPPDEPHRFSGGSQVRDASGIYQPGDATSRAARFHADDGRGGSFHELLSRYGLRMRVSRHRDHPDRRIVITQIAAS